MYLSLPSPLTVENLRKSNYKVRVIHKREWGSKFVPSVFPEYFQKNELIEARGGKTIVQVRTPDGREIEGIAICHPKDYYNRKVGLRIALSKMKEAYENHPNGKMIAYKCKDIIEKVGLTFLAKTQGVISGLPNVISGENLTVFEVRTCPYVLYCKLSNGLFHAPQLLPYHKEIQLLNEFMELLKQQIAGQNQEILKKSASESIGFAKMARKLWQP